jgi:predicted site-specific integrase-resolvase
MKLSQWAKRQGVSYQTAWNLFKKGQLPEAYQLESGTIIVPEPQQQAKPEYVVCYARVSSSQNRDNLDRQAERLTSYCLAKGYIVQEVIKECASGLNDTRPKFCKMLSNPKMTRIVVEHTDRFARFGINPIRILLERHGCTLEVINPAANDKEDLMQDFISLVTSFCARIYGKRRCKRKTEQLIKDLQDDTKNNAQSQ